MKITLEPQIVKCNDLALLNKILGRSFETKEEITDYMKANKTEVALKIFESKEQLITPTYINDAI